MKKTLIDTDDFRHGLTPVFVELRRGRWIYTVLKKGVHSTPYESAAGFSLTLDK